MEYPRAGSDFLTFTYYLKIFDICGDFVMLYFFFHVKWTVCSQVLASVWYVVLAICGLLQVKQ